MYFVRSDRRTEGYYTFLNLSEQNQRANRGVIPTRFLEENDWTINIIYDTINSPESNIFTVEHLRAIWELEDRIINLKSFPDFCLARSEFETKCNFASVFSLTTWFRLDTEDGPYNYNDHIKEFTRPD